MAEWRTGRSVGRTIYRVKPDGSEELVGVMDTRELAAEVVEALNARERPLATGGVISSSNEVYLVGERSPDCGPPRPTGRERSPEVRMRFTGDAEAWAQAAVRLLRSEFRFKIQ